MTGERQRERRKNGKCTENKENRSRSLTRNGQGRENKKRKQELEKKENIVNR